MGANGGLQGEGYMQSAHAGAGFVEVPLFLKNQLQGSIWTRIYEILVYFGFRFGSISAPFWPLWALKMAL